jgi:zinc transport system substrate-binding protein
VLPLVLLTLAAAPLKVGVTLHPYYSWAANAAEGLPIEVVPMLPGDVDAGNYQPRPEDVAKLRDLDAVIINGLGHDDFIRAMLTASGNTRCVVITPNDTAALLPSAHGETKNPHTFLSLSNAVQQTYVIARALGALRPELRQRLEQNAAASAKRLRAMKADALRRLQGARERRVLTVHDGYGYLLQELGLELGGVVEPAHGLVPSAAELAQVVAQVQREHLHVVLTEERFSPGMLEVLRQAGAKAFVISHLATGPYTRGGFEEGMQANLDTLIGAVTAP